MNPILEQFAIEQFALGNARILPEARRTLAANFNGSYYSLLQLVRSLQRGEVVESAHFENYLIRDYFIARRIISEVRAGRPEILTRYQFPQDFVLLFLALLAPEVAAQASADRSAEIQAQVQAEVERQVELTLAHQLKRSAGAIKTALGRIRKHLRPEDLAGLRRDFSRIEEEAELQANIAEKSQLFYQLPEGELDAVPLRDVLAQVGGPLRERYKQVRLELLISTGLAVRAQRDGLREVLHSLLENAFHSVAFATDLAAPRVLVRGEPEAGGETVRIEVIDNGPGVAPGDQDRIFEPRVTTKKGGGGKPLGTGMGLAIARRYAEHMGGRVGLEAHPGETCFFVRLVAARRDEG